jgi:hypothetical protein
MNVVVSVSPVKSQQNAAWTRSLGVTGVRNDDLACNMCSCDGYTRMNTRMVYRKAT